jgi:hypothetical protein
VTVDLTAVYPNVQATGGGGDDQVFGFENLVGSPFADGLLAGDDATNIITGLGGADSIVARGGADTVQIRDGEGDGASCGGGGDLVVADVAGVDVLTGDCESTRFDVRPETEIVSGPASLTRDRTPTFSFRTTKAGSTLECSLDRRPYAACRSPLTVASIADGAHTFRVRSRDALGALDLTPALRVYTTDATPPRITRLRAGAKAVRYRLSEAATVRIRVRHGESRVVRGHRGRNRVALSRLGIRSRKTVRRLRLAATDRAGNRSATRRLVLPAQPFSK